MLDHAFPTVMQLASRSVKDACTGRGFYLLSKCHYFMPFTAQERNSLVAHGRQRLVSWGHSAILVRCFARLPSHTTKSQIGFRKPVTRLPRDHNRPQKYLNFTSCPPMNEQDADCFTTVERHTYTKAPYENCAQTHQDTRVRARAHPPTYI